MTKDAGKRLDVLKRVSQYLNPNQGAIIYKTMGKAKMECVSCVWLAASETSLGRLDAIQMRAFKMIAMPVTSLSRYAIQPLAQRSWCSHLGPPDIPWRYNKI